MPLTGYPKTYDHPKLVRLEGGIGKDTAPAGKHYMLVKSMGDTSDEWIEYKVKYSNSFRPDKEETIRVTVGDSLHGPFSYVKQNNQTSGSNAYSLVYEVEE